MGELRQDYGEDWRNKASKEAHHPAVARSLEEIPLLVLLKCDSDLSL